MTRRHLLLCMILLAAARTSEADDQRESTVGMTARIDQIVLPGTELEVKPLDDRKRPVVLRILNTYPHGTNFRYDLLYYALEPGTFDLKDELRRKDGSSAADLPPLVLKIRPLLPPGQVEPHTLEFQRSPWLGGYRIILGVVGGLWLLGLGAIFLVRRRRQSAAQGLAGKPRTLADRLRPLVEQGMAGTLSQTQCAELERSLLAYWRRRLHLEQVRPADALAQLRHDAEAGPLLEQLETWLHRPGTAGQVDVTKLLKPYENLSSNALDA